MNNNMTDIIEQYIKQLFLEANEDYITLKRSNVAEKFDCVPSQLNYVMKTRFSPEHGFIIESKRGGGGFIRITKITMQTNVSYIDYLIESLDSEEASKIDYKKILGILKRDSYISIFDYDMMMNSLDMIKRNTKDTLKLLEEVDINLVLSVQELMHNNIKDLLTKFLENIKYNKERK
ncbi:MULTISPECIES: CtsR family transcriptional regulator [unclassified Gemella]|uniref:CtsR family transcriptional regulator n=1 Tax=unclassified Gemella TaxID=2624949 RepID=UPI00107371C0|nr:CtsR family transcriptional regulator [Gemella sp. GL1.1]MBF0746387.1 CtsR family transcriptional regulator [Gemella sp. 19428wG2_WT2a]NYS27978.1 CtsR family transcriptional regulator [Gemella sp. GL1]TFU60170.1 CtsR family transcriptional regulator [Gemella sp. WT2a]